MAPVILKPTLFPAMILLKTQYPGFGNMP